MPVPVASVRTIAAGTATLLVEELRGAGDGPTVTLLGGIHGDEPEGVLAVRRAVARLRTADLRGTLRAVAVANPLAHAADRRETPQDGGNLARAFPGEAGGAPTAALAHALGEEVISGSDLVLDLHSAGRRYAMPLFCGYAATGGSGPAGRRSQAAARAFGLDLVWAHDAIGPGRTVSLAHALGIPAVYVEASGGGQVRGTDLDRMVAGTIGACTATGLVHGVRVPAIPDGQRVVRGGDGDIDGAIEALSDGILVTRARAGDEVDLGDSLAEIYDDDGALVETVVAPRAGIVMLLRREARIQANDGVAVVAPRPATW